MDMNLSMGMVLSTSDRTVLYTTRKARSQRIFRKVLHMDIGRQALSRPRGFFLDNIY